MKNFECLSFKITSNLNRYKIIVSSFCDNKCKTINKRCECLSYYTNSRFLKITFLPLSNDYKIISYNLDARCNKNYIFNLNFKRNQIPSEKIYTFYLLDRNYGLKLNGILNFTKID